MKPFTLQTHRLLLDQPTASDAELMAEYCNDPLFEHLMETPWPYARRDAEWFIGEHVPAGWETDREYTWALRAAGGTPLLGVIGMRAHEAPGEWDVGYWLGGPHRGSGLMTEALRAVGDWAFDNGVTRMLWRCVAGNHASATVARKAGFRFTGAETGAHTARDGSPQENWHGELLAGEDHGPKPGWP
ncbi:RimJ/RimL family protein N-acetyltransferase [Homoserinimonas aerilata]|uniref:RimJ/RimL family protein N-acetyltransferase n=1 Tax=Homoserinimonas aerilata TaxID=1162970 RepID=A0A542YKX7_9MICO|nr:GNAT family N-acetyltransferase [Homoserinimonas aerilata]TQL48711.1 RimJ/RimL family protein N-acetyltransferase [Homoserinimonas aerilata]